MADESEQQQRPHVAARPKPRPRRRRAFKPMPEETEQAQQTDTTQQADSGNTAVVGDATTTVSDLEQPEKQKQEHEPEEPAAAEQNTRAQVQHADSEPGPGHAHAKEGDSHGDGPEDREMSDQDEQAEADGDVEESQAEAAHVSAPPGNQPDEPRPIPPPRRRRQDRTSTAEAKTESGAMQQPASDGTAQTTATRPKPTPRPRNRNKLQGQSSTGSEATAVPESPEGAQPVGGLTRGDDVEGRAAGATPPMQPRRPPPPQPSSSPATKQRLSFAINRPQQDADELMQQQADEDSSDDEDDMDADAALEEEVDEATKKERKRYKCVAEMLSTEESYVGSLSIMKDLFLARLRAAGIPKHILAEVFSNVETLYDLHSRLLNKITRRVRKWRDDGGDHIGDIFQTFAPRFKAYTEYSINFEKSNARLEERLKKSKQFADVVGVCERDETCGFLKLDAFLLEPIQRLPRFRLLLTEYLKFTPEEHPDYAIAKDALQQIMAVTSEVNESIRQKENSQKMMELQNKLEGVRIFKKDRRFLLEGSLQKMCRRGPQPRVVLLFSDMLLYAREQTTLATQYVSPRCISLQGTEARACSLADGLYGIEVKSKSKSFMLCTPNETEQRKWVDAITDAVAKDRETRHSRLPSKHRRNTEKQARFGDTAPVWIPDHDVSMCQTCAAEFNLVRRRHHCRACGKVVCSACSGESVPLAYLNNERGRVCPECFENYTKTTSKESAALMADRKRSRRKRTVDRQQSMRAVTSSKLHRPIDLDDKFIVCSSYVFEQGKFRKQRRWLLLRSDGVLFTFKAHSDPIASSSLPVLSYEVSRALKGEGQEQEYGVRLHKPLLKDYVFFCEQKDQADRWLEALTAAVESELPEWFDGEVYSDERDVATEPLQEEQEEGEGEGEGDQQQQVRHFHVNDQATGSQA